MDYAYFSKHRDAFGRIVSIHQPHIFPWLPYLYKMHLSDVFIYADNVKFKKGGDQNRFRLKGPNGVFTLTCAVSMKEGRMMPDVTLADNRFLKDLMHSVRDLFTYSSNKSRLAFQLSGLSWNIDYPFTVAAEESVAIAFCLSDLRWPREFATASRLGPAEKGSDYVLDLCKKAKARTYICGSHAKDYLDMQSFADARIGVYELSVRMDQPKGQGLSCIDALGRTDRVKDFCDAFMSLNYIGGRAWTDEDAL